MTKSMEELFKKISKRNLLELYVLADSDKKKDFFASLLGDYPY
jgi:hypothetical protein